MPELPEVEATRRHLAPTIRGFTVDRVEVRRDRMVRHQARPGDFSERLLGRRITDVGRHGKYLLIGLEEDLVWVLHLGMSGRVALMAVGEPEAPHTNVVVAIEGCTEIRLIDPRTFGFVAVFTTQEYAESSLSALGPDALEALPSARDLAGRLSGRTIAIKLLLLDQRLLAGLGNIYADEILWRARVRPDRPAGSLQRGEVTALRRAVRPVLEAGLRYGGTSLADLAYLLPDGRAGGFASRLRAYGRQDLPCRRCLAPIRRMVLGQRSTFFCAECQR